MKFQFRARIYEVGINPCVKVPIRITRQMSPAKGYIPIVGKIDGHDFRQTLCPVKNAAYRLFVNGPMLKGAGIALGDTVSFIIAQDFVPREKTYPMLKELKIKLDNNNLHSAFAALTPSRKKEILRYLNYLKTQEALSRNIEKIISNLKKSSRLFTYATNPYS